MPTSADCPHAERIAARLADAGRLDDDLAAHLRDCSACRRKLTTGVLVRPGAAVTPSLADWLTDSPEGLSAFQAEAVAAGRAAELELGPYLLLERLGAGGMGEVFRGWHKLLRRVDAVKRVRPDLAGNPAAVRRFLREAEAAARLRHPNVVAVYSADQAGDGYYLAMEFVPGSDLGRVVEKRGPLPVGEAVEYLRQAALGLQHAFEQGLVHRDIKPSNLLLTTDGATVKVADFGLARVFGEDPGERDRLTASGGFLGTYDYMAPEQADDPRAADTRSDLYSLGCTLVFLLTGRPPYPGGASWEKMARHATAPPPDVSAFRRDVPPGVVAVLHRLLAKRPEDRFQTPAELAAALAVTATPPPSRPVAVTPSAPEPATTADWADPAETEEPLDLPPEPEPPARTRRPHPPAVRTRGPGIGRVALVAGGALLPTVLAIVAVVWGLRPGRDADPNPGGADGRNEPRPPPNPAPPGAAEKGTLAAPPDLRPGEAGAGPWKPAGPFRSSRTDAVLLTGFGQEREVIAARNGARGNGAESGWIEVWPAGGGDPLLSARPSGLTDWDYPVAILPGSLAFVTSQRRRWEITLDPKPPAFRELAPLSDAIGGIVSGARAGALDAAAFTPDGKFVVGSTPPDHPDGKVRRAVIQWEGDTGGKVRTGWQIEVDDAARAVAVTPDGHRVAIGACDGAVLVRTTSDLKRNWSVPKVRGKPDGTSAVAITPDGKTVYSGHLESGSVLAWDVGGGGSKPPLTLGWEPYRMTVSDDGRWLAVAGLGLRVWDLKQDPPKAYDLVQSGPVELKGLAFHPGGKRLAAGGFVKPLDGELVGGVWAWDLTGP